jgi:hypothetical protein
VKILAGLLLCSAAWASSIVEVRDGKLQEAIDKTPPYGTVVADRTKQLEIDTTVKITKPLTLVGLNAKLRPDVGRTPILEVLSENVQIRDFVLEGNNDTVPQETRAPLIVVRRGRFLIENGETNNSSKDGVMITPLKEYGDIEHGVVRNLTAHNTIRDVVSIGGGGDEGLFVRHLVVENIRSYGSLLRGPVEVSDGSEYITVRDIYAESCAYGIDVQDHGDPAQINRNIVIEGIHVKNTPIAIRTANHDFGHHGLTVRNVAGSDWPDNNRFSPVDIRNTRGLVLENVKIDGCPARPAVFIQQSSDVTLRNITIHNCERDGAAVLLEDVDHALVDNLVVSGEKQPKEGLRYSITADREFSGLRIRNVLADKVRDVGIWLHNESKSGKLISGSILDNLAIAGANDASRFSVRIKGNLVPTP